MSSPCRSVVPITVKSIAAAMRNHGGKITKQTHLRLPARFGLKRIHCRDPNLPLRAARLSPTHQRMIAARKLLGRWHTNPKARPAEWAASNDLASAD